MEAVLNKKQFPHLRLKNMLNEIDKDSGDITLRVHDEDDDSKIELDIAENIANLKI